MESNGPLGWFYAKFSNKARKLWIADFHPVNKSRFLFVHFLLDSPPGWHKENENLRLGDGTIENISEANLTPLRISEAFTEPNSLNPFIDQDIPHKTYSSISDGPPLPCSPNDACNDSIRLRQSTKSTKLSTDVKHGYTYC